MSDLGPAFDNAMERMEWEASEYCRLKYQPVWVRGEEALQSAGQAVLDLGAHLAESRERLRRAFIAGFRASTEGYNGELQDESWTDEEIFEATNYTGRGPDVKQAWADWLAEEEAGMGFSIRPLLLDRVSSWEPRVRAMRALRRLAYHHSAREGQDILLQAARHLDKIDRPPSPSTVAKWWEERYGA